MIALDLSNKIRELIAADIPVESAGPDRAVVYMPFMYDDGDHLSIHVVNTNGRWVLSDEGDVFKRTGDLGLDFGKQENAVRLHNLIEFYGVSENNGTLNIVANDEMLTDSIFTLTQTCLEATWLAKTPKSSARREQDRFPVKLDNLVNSVIPSDKVFPNWHDKVLDPDKTYPVDYRIDAKQRQLFLFGIQNVASCMRATITCLHYEKIGVDFDSLAIYDHEEEITPRYTKQLNEVVRKTFPRIGELRPIEEYLKGFAA